MWRYTAYGQWGLGGNEMMPWDSPARSSKGKVLEHGRWCTPATSDRCSRPRAVAAPLIGPNALFVTQKRTDELLQLRSWQPDRLSQPSTLVAT